MSDGQESGIPDESEGDAFDMLVAFLFFVVIFGTAVTASLGLWSPPDDEDPDLGEIISNISVPERNGSGQSEFVTLDANITNVSSNGTIEFDDEEIPERGVSNFTLVGFAGMNRSEVSQVDSECLSSINASSRERTRSVVEGARVAIFENRNSGEYDLYWHSGNESEQHLGLALAREGLAIYTGPGTEPEAQREAVENNRGVWQCVPDE